LKPFKQQKEFKELVFFLENNNYNVTLKRNEKKCVAIEFKFPFANTLPYKLFADQYSELENQVLKEIAKTLKECGFKYIQFNCWMN